MCILNHLAGTDHFHKGKNIFKTIQSKTNFKVKVILQGQMSKITIQGKLCDKREIISKPAKWYINILFQSGAIGCIVFLTNTSLVHYKCSIKIMCFVFRVIVRGHSHWLDLCPFLYFTFWWCFNPFMPSRLSHPSKLDQFIFNIGDV